MELLKISLVTICILYAYYRTGVLLKKIIKSENENICSTILYGFILTFVMFEIINIPFIIIQKNTTKIVYILFLITNLLYILLSYIIKPKVKKYNIVNNVKSIQIKNNMNSIFYALAIIIIIFQVINSSMLFKQDADDAFYVSWATEASQLDSMYDKLPNTGLENSSFDYKYLLNTWEIYGGFIARLFNINVATLFHTVYPIIYIPIAYMAYYLVLKKVLKNKNTGLGLLLLSIIFMFSGVSPRFKGIFLLGRIHQGKSILINIIVPFVMYEFLDYHNLKRENFILLTLAYIASIACNPITIWFLSLIYGLFLAIIFIKRDFKTFVKSLIVLIPIAVVSLLYINIVLLNSTIGIEEITTTVSFSWTYVFNWFLCEGKILAIIYIISIVIIMIKGNELQKIIGVYFAAMVCLLVVNPLLKNIYIKVVTTATYWRLFWLFASELTITIASVIIYENSNNKVIKNILLVLIILTLICSGKYIYTNNDMGFSEYQNSKKIEQYILDEADYILENEEENKKVIAPIDQTHSWVIRQYTNKIILMNSRNITDYSNTEYEEKYKKIYYETDTNYSADDINKILELSEASWIILPKSKYLEISNECEFSIANENEHDYIVKLNAKGNL